MELATIKALSGTSPRKFIYNAKKANERIAELEAALAAKTAATLPQAAPLPQPATPKGCVTASQWIEQTGGPKMARDEFLKMDTSAQSRFLGAGGHIEVAVSIDSPRTKNPQANSMWLPEFLKLSPKEQTAHFAAGKKVHD